MPRKSVFVIFSAVSAMTAAGPVIAQDQTRNTNAETGSVQPPLQSPSAEDDKADASQMGDIIVTAQKREQSLNDVPMSVTALSGSQLTDRGIYNVQDLVKVTPGLSVVESGRSVPVFSLRGVGFFDTSLGARPTVSAYLDEAPIPFSIEAKGSAFDLERVEILKGPQGTLFGQNATGGAINFVAAKPTSTLHYGATASFGRFNTGDVQAFVSGPLTETLEGRVSVRTVRSGDYQRSYTRDDTLGAQRFTQTRVQLVWKPTDRLKINLTGNGFYDGSDTQAPQLQTAIPQLPFASAFPLIFSYPTAPHDNRAADWDAGKSYRAHNRFYQLNLRADYTVSDALMITSLSSYSQERIRQFQDADGTSLTNLDSTVTGKLSSAYEELRGSGRIGKLSYIVGGSYEYDRTFENDTNDYSYSTQAYAVSRPPLPLLRQIGILNRQRFSTTAGFINLDYEPLDRITLHGGARYTRANLKYSACSYLLDQGGAAVYTGLVNLIRGGFGLPALATTLVPGECGSLNEELQPALSNDKLNESNVSWRAGADFRPSRGTLLYLSASKGYKAGSTQATVVNINSQYRPVTQESLVAYEVGIKTELLDRRLQLTAAAFYYDYRNKQLSGRFLQDPNIFGALSVLVNVPRSRIIGQEVQASFAPNRALTLTVAATHLHTAIRGDFVNINNLGQQQNFGGNPFPFTPEWQVVIDGEHRRSIAGGRTVYLGANANYRSSTTADLGNGPQFRIGGYYVLDLRAGLETGGGQWRFELFGRNVTDQYYWTNVAQAADNIRRYAGTPATYGAQIRISY